LQHERGSAREPEPEPEPEPEQSQRQCRLPARVCECLWRRMGALVPVDTAALAALTRILESPIGCLSAASLLSLVPFPVPFPVPVLVPVPVPVCLSVRLFTLGACSIFSCCSDCLGSPLLSARPAHAQAHSAHPAPARLRARHSLQPQQRSNAATHRHHPLPLQPRPASRPTPTPNQHQHQQRHQPGHGPLTHHDTPTATLSHAATAGPACLPASLPTIAPCLRCCPRRLQPHQAPAAPARPRP
jgi:hypothetical protein